MSQILAAIYTAKIKTFVPILSPKFSSLFSQILQYYFTKILTIITNIFSSKFSLSPSLFNLLTISSSPCQMGTLMCCPTVRRPSPGDMVTRSANSNSTQSSARSFTVSTRAKKILMLDTKRLVHVAWKCRSL